MEKLSKKVLYQFRNFIPLQMIIEHELKLPCKFSENYFRFLCPYCNEFQTAVNTKNNLGRCFHCQENFNPIDLVMAVKRLSFLDTIEYLEPLLDKYNKPP